jgi:hypothetical protein
MRLFDAFDSGSVLRSNGASLLTTEDGKWSYDTVELLELMQSTDVNRAWVGVGKFMGGTISHALRVNLTIDGRLELYRIKGWL